MKQGSTLFLKFVVIFIGLIVLGLCIFVLPVGLMSDLTGYYAPIILGMYVAAIPFFVALHQAYKLLHYIDTNQAFSGLSVAALKHIKFAAVVISGLFTFGLPYIYYAAQKDDAPGVMAIGLFIIFASTVFATFAAVLQKLIQNGIEIKSENDLTV